MPRPPSKKNKSSNGNKRKPREGGEGSSEFVRIVFSPVSQGIRLPTVFMEYHGQSIKQIATLKVPTGDSWPIKLRQTDTGLWLGRGWKEFAEYYEIEPRHVLMFKYDGRAQFSVNIMDPTGSEIEYPMDVEDDGEADYEDDEEGRHEDDVEGYEEGCHKDDVEEVDEGRHEDDVEEDEAEEGHKEEGDEEDDAEEGHKEEGDEEDEEEGHEEGGSMSDFDVNPCGVFMGVRGQGEKKRFDSYRKAEGFRSANPFFLCFMQPTYVTDRYMVGVNLNCAEEFLPRDGDQNKTCVLKISVPNGDKVWNLTCYAYLGGRQSAIMKGWKEFAVENKLRVADVCVFELVNPQELHFNITIFRNT